MGKQIQSIEEIKCASANLEGECKKEGGLNWNGGKLVQLFIRIWEKWGKSWYKRWTKYGI